MDSSARLRSDGYDIEWVMSLDMGPNPLWQLEDLLSAMAVEPGSHVLDLGCGRGATSVFLARELDCRVTACDLWVPEFEVAAVMEATGVADKVTPVNADARDLPFAADEFDAIVSIDAFEYFGTDARFLPGLLRHLRPGGQIGMTTPGLVTDPYDQDPPKYIRAVVGWEVAAWHSPRWWARHWALAGSLSDIQSEMQPRSHDDWQRWCRLLGAPVTDPLAAMLAADVDRQVGFVQVTARKGSSTDASIP